MAGFEKRARRGLSLIELLIVSALTAILMVALVQIMVTLSSIRAEQRRVVDRTTRLFVGATLLERSIENAGYHIPAGRFAVRTYNNVASGQTYGGLDVGCDAGCILAGSDVLEVSEGHPGNMGEVRFVTPDGGSMAIVLGRVGPLPVGDMAPRVFYFGTNTNDESCIGFGALQNTTDNDKIGLVMWDRNRSPQASTYYSTTSSAPHNYDCPAVGMWVGAEERRTRFFVARGALGPTLFAQDAFTADGGGLQELAPGVDNMQLVPIVRDAGVGTDCGNGLCYCNSNGSSGCQLNGGTGEFATSGGLVGVEVRLASRGEREASTGPAVAPPILADEPAQPADRVSRRTSTQTYYFRNLGVK
jgi:prepilin-type N-terminal cleavage/methylation domain-containing protein